MGTPGTNKLKHGINTERELSRNTSRFVTAHDQMTVNLLLTNDKVTNAAWGTVLE